MDGTVRGIGGRRNLHCVILSGIAAAWRKVLGKVQKVHLGSDCTQNVHSRVCIAFSPAGYGAGAESGTGRKADGG